MRRIFWFFLLTALSDTEDSCPSVTIVGVGDSDKLTILRGCPGTNGLPGPKGDTGGPGEKGVKGDSGQPGKLGPTGQKGEKGESGMKGYTGPPGAQGIKGLPGEPGKPGSFGEKGLKGDKGDPYIPIYKATKYCKDLKDQGVILTGWYTIYPDGVKPLKVLCDMHTDGGGWIVFQRRVDGSVDFFQDWETYKTGFGSQLSEFWLGTENIHQLTATGSYELRVDLQDFEYNSTYAKYNGFKVEGEKDLYRLRLKSFKEGAAEVKIMAVGDSDKLAFIRGCPGLPGSTGQKGEPGALGPQGAVGKAGPAGVGGGKGGQGDKGDKGEKGDPGRSDSVTAQNCKELLSQGQILSDWYTIYPNGNQMKVLCDMHTDGGGWIVFQRRWDGSVDFLRNWDSYKLGFGSRLNEFWLGNDNLHKLTSIGDSLTFHNGAAFSTFDKDHDTYPGNCAQICKAGWWYKDCYNTNLNGLYLLGEYKSQQSIGVTWRTGKGLYYSYKNVEMKIKPNI